MNLKTRRFFGLMLIAAIALPTTGCAYTGGPVEGRVLEEGTDKPIPGAIVVVRWQGTAFSFVESPTVCIHVETATTDKDGRYRIPFWRASAEPSGAHGIEPIVTVYKAGYQWPRKLPKSLGDEMQYLRPFVGTREERLRFLSRIEGAMGCGGGGDSKKNLLPFDRAVYEEVLRIATPADREIVDTILIQLGYEAEERKEIEQRLNKK